MASNSLKLALLFTTAVSVGACGAESPDPEVGSLLEPISVTVPARIEAENYERFFERTPATNSGGQCDRGDGVDMQLTGDVNGGVCNVGWTDPGEWLEYDISAATSANFNIVTRVASAYSSQAFHVELDGVNVGSFVAPGNGWQSYADRTAVDVPISAGSHVIRVVFDGGLVNLNYIELTPGSATCTDGIQNGSETGIDCGGSCPPCPGCDSLPLTRSSATASSLENSNLFAQKAIDGNLSTRWSSAWSDPQWIYVDVGAVRHISRVVLRWEAAHSRSYDIEVASNTAGPWTKIFGTTSGDGGVDDITGLSAAGRYVRMYSHARATGYGNSLWEFEIYGDTDPECDGPQPTCSDGVQNGTETDVDCGGGSCAACDDGESCAVNGDCTSGLCSGGVCTAASTCSDGVQNGDETGVDCGGSCPPCAVSCADAELSRSAATASSVEGASYVAQQAIDGNTGTRWSSAFSDPQWIVVDLGATRFISRVLLDWETAASSSYDVQVGSSASGPWTTVFSTTSGDGGDDEISGLAATGRYVRMFSHARTTPWGNSLWELRVYGDNDPNCDSGVVDSDGDGLEDAVETGTGVFIDENDTGTSPTNRDTDGDGLDDGDEVLGTVNGLDLPSLGVNPLRKEVLIEYDWFDDALECGAHSHQPSAGAIDRVTTAFANAPVSNPDGSTGITLINDYGQGGAFTGGNLIPDADGVLVGNVFGAEYQGYKTSHFASERFGYFHYVILPHFYDTNSTSSGFAEIIGDDMIVSLYCAASDNNVGNTIMHELGHNLGLRHGGFEDNNFKPNYNSVMNYEYQFTGIDTDCQKGGNSVLDFSQGLNMSLDENALDEIAGVCSNVSWDFNNNLVFDATPYALDITLDGVLGVLFDWNDWSSLAYDFAPSGLGFSVQALQVQEYASCDNPAPMP
jgi:hypothetical protein